MLGGLAVRVVECVIAITTATGRGTGSYRLVTSLLDPHRLHTAQDQVIGAADVIAGTS
ncbi:hypothetical protein [Planotetraspora sp. GP83]|uniref:hypothetical protein n=1 Tax=Planotetraspora sp. GP83 TaxID=3156264 RepID=UPI0035125124